MMKIVAAVVDDDDDDDDDGGPVGCSTRSRLALTYLRLASSGSSALRK